MNDGKIEIKQIVTILDIYPKVAYHIIARNIRVWDTDVDKYPIYHDGDEIFVELDGSRYLIELYIPINTPNEKIKNVEQKCKEQLINYFENKINHFKMLINEVCSC